jgi:curved DNA-binding protein CbpA
MTTPALVLLALEFHRTPLRFGHLIDPKNPLPDAFGVWLVEAGAALAPARIDATAKSLETEADALRDAFLFLLRQVLLTPQADHYRVLGLSKDCTPDAIKHHHGLLVRLFHPDRLPKGDQRWVTLTVRINRAYQVLRDPDARNRYDRTLTRRKGGRRAPPDALGFFRARDPIASLSDSPEADAARPSRRLTALRWLLAGIALVAVMFLVLDEPSPPAPRVGPVHPDRTAQGPYYLRGHSPGQRGASPPDDSTDVRPPAAPTDLLPDDMSAVQADPPEDGAMSAPTSSAHPRQPRALQLDRKRPE